LRNTVADGGLKTFKSLVDAERYKERKVVSEKLK